MNRRRNGLQDDTCSMLDSKRRPAALRSGVPRLDAFLENGFSEVRGMSSRVSACIAGSIMRCQSEAGIVGGVVEVGVFEGRFLLALAMALNANERALGIDTFEWPDREVLVRLRKNIARFDANCITTLTADSRTINPTHIVNELGNDGVRFIHLDADHTFESLTCDLRLAFDIIDPRGVICIDDMLHPGYPDLQVPVWEALDSRPGWQLFAIVDRESITAASKFFICNSGLVQIYISHLLESFPNLVWPMHAQLRHYNALVLTTDNRLENFRE